MLDHPHINTCCGGGGGGGTSTSLPARPLVMIGRPRLHLVRHLGSGGSREGKGGSMELPFPRFNTVRGYANTGLHDCHSQCWNPLFQIPRSATAWGV